MLRDQFRVLDEGRAVFIVCAPAAVLRLYCCCTNTRVEVKPDGVLHCGLRLSKTSELPRGKDRPACALA